MSDTRNYLTDSEVAEMMEKIKNNVIKKRQTMPCTGITGSNTMEPQFTMFQDQDFKFVHENSNIQNNSYAIRSHRPFFGYFLIKGRSLINGEVKRSAEPILFKQSLFNGTLVRIISKIKESIIQNQDRIAQIEHSSNNHFESISEIKESLLQNQDRIAQIEHSSNNHFESISEVKESILQNQDRIVHIEKSSTDHFESISKLNDQVSEIVTEKDHFKSEIIQLITERCDRYDTYLKQTDMTKWGELYCKDLSEKDLMDNVEYHSYFIELIRKHAKLSAKSKIPKIIEIGLGNGTMSIFFSRNELYNVYGIDNDIDVLRYCIKNNKHLGGYIKFLLMDAFDLDILKTKEFDVAFSQGTLEHFDNESIITLIIKQLEIANYVVFSVPSVNWATREIGNERKMTLEEWRTLLNEGGLHILDLEYYKEELHIVGVISS